MLVFIFIAFALVFMIFRSRDGGGYGDQLYMTYMVLFASYDDEDYNISQKLFLSLILFLLNVVLLNLLISIMGDSYEKVQERRELTDATTRLTMILEALVYMRVFWRGKKQEKGYLVYCEPEMESDDHQEGIEWEGRINLIKKVLRQNEVKVQEVLSVNEKMEQRMGRMELEIEKVRRQMEESMSLMRQEMREGLKEIANGVKLQQ